jgi:hypothetical protein
MIGKNPRKAEGCIRELSILHAWPEYEEANRKDRRIG